MYELLDLAIREKNKDALHAWIKATTGYHVPRCRICHNHCAPFDFVADAIFREFSMALARANRSGGKTQDVAIIESIQTYHIPNLEAVNVGAIQAQADRCYGYIKEINQEKPFSSNSDPRKLTATKGEFLNGSSLLILPGTPAAVNGPHPQTNVLDEVELMPFFVLNQAFSMAQSKNGIPAQTIMVSTLKFAVGLMVRMMKEFRERGLPVYEWCIWEVVKPLPKDNPELLARIYEVFGDQLPANIDQADGYYDWEDLINKKLTLDAETWSVEWVCNQPERSGLVFSPFELEANLINEDNPYPQYRIPYEVNFYHPIYIFEDFGFGPGHPNVTLFCQVEGNDLIVFDEIYAEGKVSRENVASVFAKLEEDYGVGVNRDVQSEGYMLYRTPEIQLEWITDPARPSEREDRRQSGINVLEPVLDKVYYQLVNRIPVVRKKIEDRSLQISPKCVNLVEELQSYRFKKNADGQYSDTPEKKNDHGPDALGYGSLILFAVLAQAQMGDDSEPIVTRGPLTAGLNKTTF